MGTHSIPLKFMSLVETHMGTRSHSYVFATLILLDYKKYVLCAFQFYFLVDFRFFLIT